MCRLVEQDVVEESLDILLEMWGGDRQGASSDSDCHEQQCVLAPRVAARSSELVLWRRGLRQEHLRTTGPGPHTT
jgi:hypothetical protein